MTRNGYERSIQYNMGYMVINFETISIFRCHLITPQSSQFQLIVLGHVIVMRCERESEIHSLIFFMTIKKKPTRKDFP